MSSRNTFVRSLHDLGAAAWFGGSLMGAIGVNGAAASVRDPHDRAKVAAVGWGKWAPVNAVAIGAHLIGGGGLLYANRGRAKHQSGVTSNTIAKTALTAAALGATVLSGLLGAKTARGDGHPVEGATEPSPSTPDDVAAILLIVGRAVGSAARRTVRRSLSAGRVRRAGRCGMDRR